MVGCDKIFDIEDDNPILRLNKKHVVEIDGKFYKLDEVTLSEISITSKEKTGATKTFKIEELEEAINNEKILGVIA